MTADEFHAKLMDMGFEVQPQSSITLQTYQFLDVVVIVNLQIPVVVINYKEFSSSYRIFEESDDYVDYFNEAFKFVNQTFINNILAS